MPEDKRREEGGCRFGWQYRAGGGGGVQVHNRNSYFNSLNFILLYNLQFTYACNQQKDEWVWGWVRGRKGMWIRCVLPGKGYAWKGLGNMRFGMEGWERVREGWEGWERDREGWEGWERGREGWEGWERGREGWEGWVRGREGWEGLEKG